MLKNRILEDLKKAVKDLGYPITDPDLIGADIVLSIPKNSSFGDYSTNLALQLAKLRSVKDKQSPMEIANEIVSRVKSLESSKEYLEKVEVAGAGFINFFIKTDTLIKNLQHIICNTSFALPVIPRDPELVEGDRGNLSTPLETELPIPWKIAASLEDSFLAMTTAKSVCNKAVKKNREKVMVEFTDPNPFKEFHIGHVFSNAVGESLSRLFQHSGAIVWRANFFGDVGMHVAKAIFGLREKFKVEEELDKLGQKPLKERVEFMGQAYTMGATAYEENAQAKKEIERLNLLIFVAAQEYWQETKNWKPRVDYRKYITQIDEVELTGIKNLWVKGREWSLQYFETIYAILGTKFDGYYPESLTGEWGYDFVVEGLKKGIFEESEGAVVYRGEKHGLHTRVFINKLGLPTYETKDIGNAPCKYSEFEYDKSLIVTANEINEYFQVVIAALKEVNPKLGGKTIHLGHGVVKLPEGKMSSRTGKVFTFEELFEAVRSKIERVLKDFDIEDKEHMLNVVAVGAIKFAMLKHQPSIDTIFDLDKSVALEGDSGPYIQYTYARAKSVLRKVKEVTSPLEDSVEEKLPVLSEVEVLFDRREIPYGLSRGGELPLLSKEERQILQKIEYFEGIIEEAIQSLHPNLIAGYLLDLASDFNLFYQKHRIINAGDNKKQFRLALTSAVSIVLKQGLYLLGIETVEKM